MTGRSMLPLQWRHHIVSGLWLRVKNRSQRVFSYIVPPQLFWAKPRREPTEAFSGGFCQPCLFQHKDTRKPHPCSTRNATSAKIQMQSKSQQIKHIYTMTIAQWCYCEAQAQRPNKNLVHDISRQMNWSIRSPWTWKKPTCVNSKKWDAWESTSNLDSRASDVKLNNFLDNPYTFLLYVMQPYFIICALMIFTSKKLLLDNIFSI